MLQDQRVDKCNGVHVLLLIMSKRVLKLIYKRSTQKSLTAEEKIDLQNSRLQLDSKTKLQPNSPNEELIRLIYSISYYLKSRWLPVKASLKVFRVTAIQPTSASFKVTPVGPWATFGGDMK